MLLCLRTVLSDATAALLVVTKKSTSRLGQVLPLVLLFHFALFKNVIIPP